MPLELTAVCGEGLYDPFLGLLMVLPLALFLARVRYISRGRRFVALGLND